MAYRRITEEEKPAAMAALSRAYRVRRLPADDLGPMMKLYEQLAPTRHGAFAREEWWWRALRRPRSSAGEATTNLLLETADGLVGWAMLAFGTETSSSNEPIALRVRVQDWGWLPGHDPAVLGVLAGYRTMDGIVRWTGPDPAGLEVLRTAFAGPKPFTPELY